MDEFAYIDGLDALYAVGSAQEMEMYQRDVTELEKRVLFFTEKTNPSECRKKSIRVLVVGDVDASDYKTIQITPLVSRICGVLDKYKGTEWQVKSATPEQIKFEIGDAHYTVRYNHMQKEQLKILLPDEEINCLRTEELG